MARIAAPSVRRQVASPAVCGELEDGCPAGQGLSDPCTSNVVEVPASPGKSGFEVIEVVTMSHAVVRPCWRRRADPQKHPKVVPRRRLRNSVSWSSGIPAGTATINGVVSGIRPRPPRFPTGALLRAILVASTGLVRCRHRQAPVPWRSELRRHTTCRPTGRRSGVVGTRRSRCPLRVLIQETGSLRADERLVRDAACLTGRQGDSDHAPESTLGSGSEAPRPQADCTRERVVRDWLHETASALVRPVDRGGHRAPKHSWSCCRTSRT